MQPDLHRTFVWRGVTARLSVQHNHRIDGWTLLRLQVTNPSGAPLPFAIDGRLDHGEDQDVIDAAGGITRYLTAWAERESLNPGYLNALVRWRQGDLFGR